MQFNDRPESNTLLSKSSMTKLNIVNSLQNMLTAGKTLDRLSTRELCKSAGIGKSTFYKYFSDKYSVVQWYLDLLYENGVEQIGRSMTWSEGYRVTICGILEKRILFQKAAKSSDYNAIGNYSLRKRESDLIQTLQNYRNINITPRILGQVTAVVAAETAIMSRVISDSLSMDEGDLVNLLTSIVPNDLRQLLEDPE